MAASTVARAIRSVLDTSATLEALMAVRKADSRVGRIRVGRHKITRAPDPVDKIARELGIQIKLDKVDADLSGFIVRDNGKRVLIGVEQAPPSKPAAVLGHYFLHAGRAFG